jgi:hypothetical protein
MFQNQQMTSAEKISTRTGPVNAVCSPTDSLPSNLVFLNPSNLTEIESSIDLSTDQLPWDSTIFDDNELFKTFENDVLNEHAIDDFFLDSNSLDPVQGLISSSFDMFDDQPDPVQILQQQHETDLTFPIASPPDQAVTSSNDSTMNYSEQDQFRANDSRACDNAEASAWTRFGNKKVLKYSGEYHQRRWMNNRAVKRAREKAKEKEKTIALKMSMLVNENQQLFTRLNQLTEELNSFKSSCDTLNQRLKDDKC